MLLCAPKRTDSCGTARLQLVHARKLDTCRLEHIATRAQTHSRLPTSWRPLARRLLQQAVVLLPRRLMLTPRRQQQCWLQLDCCGPSPGSPLPPVQHHLHQQASFTANALSQLRWSTCFRTDAYGMCLR